MQFFSRGKEASGRSDTPSPILLDVVPPPKTRVIRERMSANEKDEFYFKLPRVAPLNKWRVHLKEVGASTEETITSACLYTFFNWRFTCEKDSEFNIVVRTHVDKLAYAIDSSEAPDEVWLHLKVKKALHDHYCDLWLTCD